VLIPGHVYSDRIASTNNTMALASGKCLTASAGATTILVVKDGSLLGAQSM